jgi:5-hydroxyisourate hydrolase
LSYITTHVLDTSEGRPASGLGVRLERREGSDWREVGRGETDGDGRLRTLAPSSPAPGVYRLTFDTGAYFASQQRPAFYPLVTITFDTIAGQDHYHVPLLLAPFGYSTYRGS